MKKILILALVASLTLSSLFSCTDNNAKESESITETEIKTENERLPAQEISGEGFEFALSEDKTYYTVVSKGTCADEKITIPATYNGVPVKSIAKKAFASLDGISEITLAEGITDIEAEAFANIKGLKKVTLPNSLTKIADSAFFGCADLESVTFGNGLTDIGRSAFENCVSLKSVSIPDSTKTIDVMAFCGCTSLADVKLGNGLTQIKQSAFDNTAFVKDTKNWQNNVLYSGQYLLSVAPEFSGELTIKDGTVLVADHAAKRSSITSIAFPSSLKHIGSAAFTACLKLTSIALPDGIVSIGEEAFASCDALVSATLPNTLTSMGELSFYHCSNLKSITIPSSIHAIPDQAFNECAALEEINLPNTLESIGVYSFANCYSLIKITFPDSLKAIGNSAFYKCYNLLSINLPKNLEKLGDWSFQHCQKLLDVKNESSLDIKAKPETNSDNGYVGTYANEIHNGESKIIEQDGYLFYSYNNKNYLVGHKDMNATSLTLPESFNGQSYIIYKYAFSFRPALQTVIITAGATAINANSFDNCPALSELTFGTSITSIAKNAITNSNSFNKLIFLGTEAEFNSININATNTLLLNAQRVYN